ncbi:putative Mn2+ efflux pump MntP [Psychromicrobium silvestre]|uniref:Putative Mn2+ efflux pump MntP n=1 Tax=Psychromicrobium silvestre TaxID=1645614 RepID=A0A7Y9LTS7_9MICC|nr:manganese efflux pump [Psychromicrobium silvestre]NYE95458.1 putative Mn2+ efflux pump MntP [Psychromicrobium silvestre]
MIALILLGFGLSLDNFRTSIALGGLKPTLRQSINTSAIFALWDGVAPLVGMLIGEYVSTMISDTAEMIGAAGLAGYGLWVIFKAIRSPEHADLNMKTARRWLPVPLSIDNVLGGATLGLAGYSPWIAPILFAFTTFVMSVAGHQIGRTIANFIPRLRTDLLTGIAFVLMAGLVVAGVGDS